MTEAANQEPGSIFDPKNIKVDPRLPAGCIGIEQGDYIHFFVLQEPTSIEVGKLRLDIFNAGRPAPKDGVLTLRQDERDYLQEELTRAENSLRIELDMEPGSHRAVHALGCTIKALRHALDPTPAPDTAPKDAIPAPDRVCICGHSKADHSEKHGWECSEECTCLKYTPAPDRDAVRVHEMAEALAASHSRLVKVHAALTALCGPDADWWGETEGYCPACGEKVGNELPCHDDAHAPDCLFIKGRKALTPSHPSAGRDEVREALALVDSLQAACDKAEARVAELEKVYAAAESLLKEAREDCVTELEFQAILKPGGKALQTAVIDARMQALTPSHPSAGRDEVREAADEMFRTAVCRNAGTDPFTGQAFTECGACPLCKARVAYKQALATPQGKEDAS